MGSARELKDPFWPQQPWGTSHTPLFQECTFCGKVSCCLKEAADSMPEKKQVCFKPPKETGCIKGHLEHCDGGMKWHTGFINFNWLSRENWLFIRLHGQNSTLHSHRGKKRQSSCQSPKGANWCAALSWAKAAALSPLQLAQLVKATSHATDLLWGPNSNCRAYEWHEPLGMKQVPGFHVIKASLE